MTATAGVNDELTVALLERDQAWAAFEELKRKVDRQEVEIAGLKRVHYRNRPFVTGFDRISAVTIAWQQKDEAALRSVLEGIEEIIAVTRRKVTGIERTQEA